MNVCLVTDENETRITVTGIVMYKGYEIISQLTYLSVYFLKACLI